jgi:hypothetical protein
MGGDMTHDQIERTETLLIDIATTGAHIETAILYIRHDQNDRAIRELQRALGCCHQLKLKAMVFRWLECPDTLRNLIQEQIKWLQRKYRVFNS